MEDLLKEIRGCRYCEAHLPLGPRPIVNMQPTSKILVMGQAPGTKVHETGIAWNDQSGMRLREWLNVDNATFYNESNFGIMPMGFCYPGKGKSGDLPPRKECTTLWHDKLFAELTNVKLILLIGQYAQKQYLEIDQKLNLTQRVENFEAYLPTYFVLPHPSPRNAIWRKKNSWFERDIVPILQDTVNGILR